MKQKNDQGFSLVEVLVAIVILAAFTVPTCSALVLSARMNEKTQTLMQAQLAVSSALEELSARGIKEEDIADLVDHQELTGSVLDAQYKQLLENYPNLKRSQGEGSFDPGVFWIVAEAGACYEVTAISLDGAVEASTSIRKVS